FVSIRTQPRAPTLTLRRQGIEPKAALHRTRRAASKTREDQARQACGGATLEPELPPATGERTLLVVLDPPVPRELVEVAVITDDDEPHRHDMDSVAAARLLRTIRAVQRRIAGILRPIARLADEMAPWTLKPAREANTDELAGVVAIHAGRYLRRDGRQ